MRFRLESLFVLSSFLICVSEMLNFSSLESILLFIQAEVHRLLMNLLLFLSL